MQYSDEEHNHLGEYTPAYLSRFTLAPGMQRPDYSQNVAPVLAPAPDPLSTLASIPRGHGYHQHVASLSTSNSTPHWTNASFLPPSGDGTALFTPPPLNWELPSGPQHYAHGAQQELQYHDVPRFSPSPTFGFQFQPENMSSLPTTNPFGAVDRDGSFVPGHGPVQHRVNATARQDERLAAPVPSMTPRPVLQGLRDESTVDRGHFGVGADATPASKRKAEDDVDDTPEPDARAVEDAARKTGVPGKGKGKGKGKGAAAARASKGHRAKSSQRGSRKKGRIDSDETTATSTDDLRPRVQADNNPKSGAKPRTPLGRALESFNATKVAGLLKLVEEVARTKSVHDALAILPEYSETPTVEDMNGFKATLALVVATSAIEATSTCDACVTDFEVAVPFAATTTVARHLSEYHRGLRTCPACGYLLVQRGTNGAERHRAWCPIWRVLGEKAAQEEWLRQRGLLAVDAPSSQFFSEDTVKSAEDVAKGDRAVMERELLASLKTSGAKKSRGKQAATPAVATTSAHIAQDNAGGGASVAGGSAEWNDTAESVYDVDNQMEGGSNAPFDNAGSCAPSAPRPPLGIDVLAGPEWDEDADGEYDLDVDDEIDSCSALYTSAGVHGEPVVVFRSIDGGSNAGVQGAEEGRAALAHGMDGREDARAESDDGAQRAATPWGLVRGEMSSTQSHATQLADGPSRIHAGVRIEAYGAFGGRTSEAEHAGDWPSWEHGDVIETTYTVEKQSWIDSAATGTVGHDAFEAMRDHDPYSFDDTTATLQDLDDFYA